MRSQFRSLLACSIAFLLLSSGCKKQTPALSTALSASGPKDPDLRVSPAGYHGRHFSGPVYVPRASPMEDGTTAYNVVYQKGVTVVSKDDTRQHLLAIHPDGSYVFDTNASQVGRLKADSIVLFSGLAVRTVNSVEKTSQGYLLKTSPAKITDAIKTGRLEGTYKIDFSRMQSKTSSSLRSWEPETVLAAVQQVTATLNTADFDVNFSGYNYHIKFTPAEDRINVQATIKYGGSQGELAYEGVGYLSNFVANIRMQIKNGEVTNLDFIDSNLTGQVNLKWYAAASSAMHPGTMAKITSWPAELFKSTVLSKAAYDVPIVLGALPLDLRISLGFSFIPDFTATNSAVEGSKLIKFSGSGGFNFVNGQTRPSGAFQVDGNIDGHDSTVHAQGPVGFTAATEAPRLDLALGWPPEPPPLAGYLNFVTSYGIVTNGLANPNPCQTNIMAFSVNAGAAYSSANTFANWPGTAPGVASSVSLWSKTFKSPGPTGVMCPN